MTGKRIIALLLTAVMLLGVAAPATAAPEDELVATAADEGDLASSLIDIELVAFKGSRNEFNTVPLEEPIEAGKYDYVMNVDMKQWSDNDCAFYVKPVTYDENATIIINGEEHDFNVPARIEVPKVTYDAAEATQEVVCEIDVVSADGQSTSNYTLTFISQDLYDRVKVTVLEENYENGELISGVYQFTSINGFTTAEDCAIFIGKDKALLFDALNAGTQGSRRGGDLKQEIYTILTEKFGVDNPDEFVIDVAISHNHGDHVGMVNPNVGSDAQLSGRGDYGTVYWPLKDANTVSDGLFAASANTNMEMVVDGDIIVGPDFGDGPLLFEAIEVPCHTLGSTVYLYDNDAGGQCTQNYLVLGDAISSGSYVFTYGGGKDLVATYSRAMEKLWNRVKGLDGLHALAGHSWQERVPLTGDATISMIEDMYIATRLVVADPEVGTFDTSSATAYLRKLSYGLAGYWYNDFGTYDYEADEAIVIDPAHLLSLVVVDEAPQKNLILNAGGTANYNPRTTAWNVEVNGTAPLYLMAEAFGEDADISVTLNGAAVTIDGSSPWGDRMYTLSGLTSGLNVVEIDVSDAASGTAVTYTVNIVTDGSTPPDISGEYVPIPSQPSLHTPVDTSTLNDVQISSFKGGRLEPYNIELDEPIDLFTWDNRDLHVTMDWSGATSDVVYIVPVTTDPNASYTINGEECRYPIPYRYELSEGDNVLDIVVNPGSSSETAYTLTISATYLWDQYWSEEIEPGVWRIQDAAGFVTNDDMYLFVGDDKAMLFDTGMGEGDLRGYVEAIIGDPGIPIEVVITHAHGDHYGRVEQFADCTVYWPTRDARSIPRTYDKSNYVYPADGDILQGPDGITFECIEVVGHTSGSMCYLYDNQEQGKLSNSYLVTGDALGSGSYVFFFGSGAQAFSDYLDDLKKLEGKIAKFADGFYDTDKNVTYDEVDGLYFLSGHSWQEASTMQPMYAPMWLNSSPLQKLAGIQMVRDMRIAVEKVYEGEWEGKLYTRNLGSTTQELRQLSYRQAGLWYNGSLTVSATANEGGYVDASTVVELRGDAAITVRPDEGYRLAAVLVDGVTKDLSGMQGDTFVIEDVQKNLAVRALFIEDTEVDHADRYDDVNVDDWFYSEVDTLTGLSVVQGVSEDAFEPERETKRSEFAQLMFNLATVLGQEPQETDDAPFTDLPEDYWATGVIGWAYEAGIIEGYNAEEFGPEDDIAREDMALAFFRYLERTLGYSLEGDTVIDFADTDEIDAWAGDAIDYVVRTGLMQGYEDGGVWTFQPQKSTFRNEIATLFYNYLIYSE